MKITFDPPADYGPTGVVSFASWDNGDLQAAIRQAFNESAREQIVEIVITRAGIKARFETRAAVKQ